MCLQVEGHKDIKQTGFFGILLAPYNGKSRRMNFLRDFSVISEDGIPVKHFPEKPNQMQRAPNRLHAYLQEAFARE